MKFEGRPEVERRRQKLKSLFSAIDQGDLTAELLAHYSRYLCVLVSGYVEASVKELASCYCKNRSSDPIHRYVTGQLNLLRNIDLDKLRKLVQSFSPEWWRLLEDEMEDELQAFVSIAALRNNIAHGGDSGITLGTVQQYFAQVSSVLRRLGELFDPDGKIDVSGTVSSVVKR